MTLKDSGADVKSLLALVGEWAKENLPKLSLAEAEQLAQQVGRAVAQQVLSTAAEQVTGRATYEGTRLPCVCGKAARFVGYRERWLRSLCGDLRVGRAYYHCAACGRGQAPWDSAEGLGERVFSPGVRAVVAECCARLTHGETEALLERVLGLKVEESSQQALVGELGVALRAEEDALREACFERLESVPHSGPPPERLYIGMDAAKAHIDGVWHDIKCGAIYRGELAELRVVSRRGQETRVRRDRSGPKRYLACQEEAAGFGQRLYVEALREGVEQAKEVVILGDGAEWIWNLAAEHFHGATQVLDFYHAAEHVWDLAKALYGEDARGKQWAEARCRDLKQNGPKGLLRALKRRKPTDAAAAEALRSESNYFRKNRQRMEYGKYRARGLMIGSGPVEAACKIIVGRRLKGVGMRWSTEGADAMLAVRTAVLNGQTERIERLARAA